MSKKYTGTLRLWIAEALSKLTDGPRDVLAVHDSRPLRNPVPSVASFRGQESRISLPPGLLRSDIEAAIDADVYPLPHADDREGYHEARHYDFWLSGLIDHWSMRRAIGQWLPEGNSTVLDLGCATGRVLRHVLLQEPRADLFAADLNSRHIQWLSRHIKCDRIKPFQNSVLPNLPLPDSTLDLVYAFSVFTHIDSFELGWLAELRRILKPGGIAYITIHSEHTWESMDPAWSLYRNLVGQSMAGGHAVDEATFEKPMPSERVVMRWRRSGSYNCNVFHHSAYVYDLWGRFLEVQDIIRRGSDYQDVVVLRRT